MLPILGNLTRKRDLTASHNRAPGAAHASHASALIVSHAPPSTG
jgi:hypothetical protein